MLEGMISSTADEATEWSTARRAGSESRRRDLLARMSAMSLAGFGRRLDGDRATETEATAVARTWLELVDAGRPVVSWTAAGPALRETIRQSEWVMALRAVRQSLGPCRARTLRARAIVEAFPGVPPGPYAVLRFASAFEGRSQVLETVTVCRGHYGRWRVAAYFIG